MWGMGGVGGSWLEWVVYYEVLGEVGRLVWGGLCGYGNYCVFMLLV